MSDTPYFSINIRREAQRFTAMGERKIKHDWNFTDEQGHIHTELSESYEWVVTGGYWCDSCNEIHETGEYRCKLCAQVVDPDTFWTDPQAVYVPGLLEGELKLLDGTERTYRLVGGDVEDYGKSNNPKAWVDKIISTRQPDSWVEVSS